jgi:hypothetical protein
MKPTTGTLAAWALAGSKRVRRTKHTPGRPAMITRATWEAQLLISLFIHSHSLVNPTNSGVPRNKRG